MAKYSNEQIETLFRKVTKGVIYGKPLRQILSQSDMPGVGTFYDWLEKRNGYAERYARAKAIAADMLFDELLDVARTPILGETVEDGPNGLKVTTGDMLGHRRLLYDAIRWRLAKEAPKKYGDKIDVTSGNEALALPPIVGMVIKNEIQPDGPDDNSDLF